MDIKTEQEAAKKNYEKIIKAIPAKLNKKEEKLYFRFQKVKATPTRKLSLLYKETDEIYAAITPYTPCKKGCSACCYYEVTISEVEIRYIEENTKFKRTNVIKDKTNFHGTPCPFLKNNSCSIYEFRPFMCRRHITLAPTNHWCQPDVSLKHQFSQLDFSEIRRTYNLIKKETNSMEVWDIRQVFNLNND
jgi:Fe-S-cluster containining protein